MKPDASYTVPHIIDGVPLVSSDSFAVVNPATGEKLWSASNASTETVAAAVAAATTAYPAWRALGATARGDLLLAAAAQLEKATPELVEAMMLETAADENWCLFNIANSLEMLRGVAGRLPAAVEGRLPVTRDPNTTALIVKEPYGVVLSIAPWNAPIVLAFRAIVYPLAAGNAVIFKLSELSPRTHQLCVDVFLRAGLPKGVLGLLGHSRESAAEVTQALIAAPQVRKINFTGSTAVGRKIAEMAGHHLKPVMLELGGKAAMIVCQDADLAAASAAGAFGAFHYGGQICMSSERILVHRAVAAEFTAALQAAAAKMYGSRQVLVQSAAPQRVSALLRAAEAAGAATLRVAAGSGAEAVPGADTAPKDRNAHDNVIVSGVDTSMDLWYTESFGPVVAVTEFSTDEEAVRLANETEYGLSAAVWTRDIGRGLRLARDIESGAVHINGATIHDEVSLPHGGVKSSGFGRFNGSYGLDEFLVTKVITFRS